MDDCGVTENIGTILMICILVLVAAFAAVYAMNIESSSIPMNYNPQYAIVQAEVIPGLSGNNKWEADSIKIKFSAGNELDLSYQEGHYTGTEGIKFMLLDPNGESHEAMQSITMEGQKIQPGDVFYYFTVSSNINGQYYVTNDYSRVGDNSKWGGGWSYLKPFKPGKWHAILIDDSLGVIIADEEVTIT